MAPGDRTEGRRLDSVATFYSDRRQPGDYVPVRREADGEIVWYICDPRGKVGRIGQHTVTEHEDGTITVDPSILDPEPGGWHGYLEAGVWRKV